MLVQSKPHGKKLPVRIILLTGLLVGTLDISAAFIDYYITTGKSPVRVLTYIASGVLGRSAFSGGADVILLGLLFHYIIAFSFTILFFWLYARNRSLWGNRIIIGSIYGVFIWLVMNLVVVQLSNAPHTPVTGLKPGKIIKPMLILIFMIGLPLSFIGYNYFSGQLSKIKSTD